MLNVQAFHPTTACLKGKRLWAAFGDAKWLWVKDIIIRSWAWRGIRFRRLTTAGGLLYGGTKVERRFRSGAASRLDRVRHAGHRFWRMTLKLTIDVPEHVAEQARAAGLLQPKALAGWLREELRRRKVGVLKEVLDRVAVAPGEPMSEEEIEAEIAAARAERRKRAAGRR